MFEEKPFNLTIDLAYFFLGRDHQKTIAHLTYTVFKGEGFIAITAERGPEKQS